jgi:hypothetical protein
MRRIVYGLYHVDFSPYYYIVQGEYGEKDEVVYDYNRYDTIEEAQSAIPPNYGGDVVILPISVTD